MPLAIAVIIAVPAINGHAVVAVRLDVALAADARPRAGQQASADVDVTALERTANTRASTSQAVRNGGAGKCGNVFVLLKISNVCPFVGSYMCQKPLRRRGSCDVVIYALHLILPYWRSAMVPIGSKRKCHLLRKSRPPQSAKARLSRLQVPAGLSLQQPRPVSAR
jgi:hypothetical protein